GYVARAKGGDAKMYRILMHRDILQTPPGRVSDHINGDKLDNRRENLRICTQAENARNLKPTSGRSMPKGVCWAPDRRRFRARIVVNYHIIQLGSFRTETEADAAYKAAAVEYFGEFARKTQSNKGCL